jgi:hypothetical protein
MPEESYENSWPDTGISDLSGLMPGVVGKLRGKGGSAGTISV